MYTTGSALNNTEEKMDKSYFKLACMHVTTKALIDTVTGITSRAGTPGIGLNASEEDVIFQRAELVLFFSFISRAELLAFKNKISLCLYAADTSLQPDAQRIVPS